MIEQKLRQISQYFPACADEPLAEKRPHCYLYLTSGQGACHNELPEAFWDCKNNCQNFLDEYLLGGHSLINTQDSRTQHSCPLESLTDVIHCANNQERYFHELLSVRSHCEENQQSCHYAPLQGKQAPDLVHSKKNHQEITMEHCLDSLNQAIAISSEITKQINMSETYPLRLYVLASQSSHDYTQDTYGQHRQSFVLRPKVSKLKRGS